MNLALLERWIGERQDGLAAGGPDLAQLGYATVVIGELGEHAARLGFPTILGRCRGFCLAELVGLAREILADAAAQVRRAILEERKAGALTPHREWFTAAELAEMTGRPHHKVSEDLRLRVIEGYKAEGTSYWRVSPGEAKKYLERWKRGRL